MSVATGPQAERSPTYVVQPPAGLFHLDLGAVWRHRELLFFLVWRDVKVRYKQTVIGMGWAVLQPLTAIVIFSVVFGNFAKIPSEGVPYPVFAYAALLPWLYFSQALTRSGGSLVANVNLVSKVYFPRLIVPLSGALAPLVDFAIALVILLGLMAWYGIAPTWGILALPLFLFMAFATAVAVSLWLSALNVRYRDVQQALPFLVQFWMYASPVVYSTTLVPEKWRLFYGLNPMVGVIEGFRWALLGTPWHSGATIGLAVGVVLLILVSGLVYFHRTEKTFADII